MLASESWAEAKFVTERVGIPRALNTEKETLVCWRKIVNDSYYLRKPASFRYTNSNGGTHSVITVAYLLSLHFTVEGNGELFLH